MVITYFFQTPIYGYTGNQLIGMPITLITGIFVAINVSNFKNLLKIIGLVILGAVGIAILTITVIGIYSGKTDIKMYLENIMMISWVACIPLIPLILVTPLAYGVRKLFKKSLSHT